MTGKLERTQHGMRAVLYEGDLLIEFIAFKPEEAYINVFKGMTKTGGLSTNKDQLLRVIEILFPSEQVRRNENGF